MNSFKFLCICLSLFMGTLYAEKKVHKNRMPIDTIKSVVYGDEMEDIAVITLSDITYPGIDGVVHQLYDKEIENLIRFDGRKHRIEPTPSDIDRHLNAVKQENNIDDEQLTAIFNSAGFTYEEGREQFGIMYMVNTMVDFKVRSGLFVSRIDVQKYYDENPEYIDAELLLKQGFVPFDYKISQKQQFDNIVNEINTNSGIKGVQWSPPFTILQNSISIDKQFLLNLEVNQISMPLLMRDGFELFQLVGKTERRLKTLDERYGEIAELLRRPKYQELLTNYKIQLYENAAIVHF